MRGRRRREGAWRETPSPRRRVDVHAILGLMSHGLEWYGITTPTGRSSRGAHLAQHAMRGAAAQTVFVSQQTSTQRNKHVDSRLHPAEGDR